MIFGRDSGQVFTSCERPGRRLLSLLSHAFLSVASLLYLLGLVLGEFATHWTSQSLLSLQFVLEGFDVLPARGCFRGLLMEEVPLLGLERLR